MPAPEDLAIITLGGDEGVTGLQGIRSLEVEVVVVEVDLGNDAVGRNLFSIIVGFPEELDIEDVADSLGGVTLDSRNLVGTRSGQHIAVGRSLAADGKVGSGGGPSSRFMVAGGRGNIGLELAGDVTEGKNLAGGNIDSGLGLGDLHEIFTVIELEVEASAEVGAGREVDVVDTVNLVGGELLHGDRVAGAVAGFVVVDDHTSLIIADTHLIDGAVTDGLSAVAGKDELVELTVRLEGDDTAEVVEDEGVIHIAGSHQGRVRAGEAALIVHRAFRNEGGRILGVILTDDTGVRTVVRGHVYHGDGGLLTVGGDIVGGKGHFLAGFTTVAAVDHDFITHFPGGLTFIGNGHLGVGLGKSKREGLGGIVLDNLVFESRFLFAGNRHGRCQEGKGRKFKEFFHFLFLLAYYQTKSSMGS